MATSPRFDLPMIEDETRAFWDAAREDRLLLRHCRACDAVHYYPRPFCPSCWADDVEWVEAGGRATLYTHSTVFRNDLPPFGDEVPYIAAVVELAEGPRMMTRIIDCEPADLRIGMPLAIAFVDRTEDLTIAVFRPA